MKSRYPESISPIVMLTTPLPSVRLLFLKLKTVLSAKRSVVTIGGQFYAVANDETWNYYCKSDFSYFLIRVY